MYVSIKVVWQPGHRGATTTVLEPAGGELMHAMHPEAGPTGATLCGLEATRVERSWSSVTLPDRCARCQVVIDQDEIDLRDGSPVLEADG